MTFAAIGAVTEAVMFLERFLGLFRRRSTWDRSDFSSEWERSEHLQRCAVLCFYEHQDAGRALEYFNRARGALARWFAGERPERVDANFSDASVHLARIHAGREDLPGALAILRRVQGAAGTPGGLGPFELATTCYMEGLLHHQQEQDHEAHSAFRRALEALAHGWLGPATQEGFRSITALLEETLRCDSDDPVLADRLQETAGRLVLFMAGKPGGTLTTEEARWNDGLRSLAHLVWHHFLGVRRRRRGDPDGESALIAGLLMVAGRFMEGRSPTCSVQGRPLLAEALALIERRQGADHPEAAKVRDLLAAVSPPDTVRAHLARIGPGDPVRSERIRLCLCRSLHRSGDPRAALEEIEGLRKEVSASRGPVDGVLLECLEESIDLLRALERYEEMHLIFGRIPVMREALDWSSRNRKLAQADPVLDRAFEHLLGWAADPVTGGKNCTAGLLDLAREVYGPRDPRTLEAAIHCLSSDEESAARRARILAEQFLALGSPPLDPGIRSLRARLYLRLSQVLGSREPAQAASHARNGIALLRQLVDLPGPVLLEALESGARTCRAAGELDVAARFLDEAIALAAGVGGETLIRLMDLLAEVELLLGAGSKAILLLEEVLARRPRRGSEGWKPQLKALGQLVEAHHRTGSGKASSLLEDHLAGIENEEGWSVLDRTEVKGALAHHHSRIDRMDRARELLEEAIRDREPLVDEYEQTLVDLYTELAVIFRGLGRPDDARRIYAAMLVRAEDRLGDHHPEARMWRSSLERQD